MDKLSTGFINKKNEIPKIIRPILQTPEQIAEKEVCKENGNFDKILTKDENIMNQMTIGILKGIVVGVVVGLILFGVIKHD